MANQPINNNSNTLSNNISNNNLNTNNMEFLKNVSLQNGGYVCNEAGAPVYNKEFVEAQQAADYIVTMSRLAKGKNFKQVEAEKVYTMAELKELTSKEMSGRGVTQFFDAPAPVEQPLTEGLKKEALAFMESLEVASNNEKLNSYMQQFQAIKDFEDFGLFFTPGVVKLNKIYTLKEIKDAVYSMRDIL